MVGTQNRASTGLGGFTVGDYANNNGAITDWTFQNEFDLQNSMGTPSQSIIDARGSAYNDSLNSNNDGLFGNSSFGMDTALGLGKLGVGLGNLWMANKQLGLAEDRFKFNKADRNRVYEANKRKYNNAVRRTNAVNAHYGVGNTSSLI